LIYGDIWLSQATQPLLWIIYPIIQLSYKVGDKQIPGKFCFVVIPSHSNFWKASAHTANYRWLILFWGV